MAISNLFKDYLNSMNRLAQKVSLGTLIQNLGSGSGLDSSSISTAKIAADAITNALIADDAVSLEHLDSGIEPSHVAKYAGKHTSTADGSAPYENAVTVTGAAATDIVIASMQTQGASPVTLLAAIPSTNTITFSFSADPSTDHIISYMVFRAAA